MYLFVCVHAYMWAHVCTDLQCLEGSGGPPSQLPLPLLFKKGLSRSLKLTDLAKVTGQGASGSICLLPSPQGHVQFCAVLDVKHRESCMTDSRPPGHQAASSVSYSVSSCYLRKHFSSILNKNGGILLDLVLANVDGCLTGLK